MEYIEENAKDTKFINNSCRICMGQETVVNDIFQPDCKIIDKVLFCTGIQFIKDNSLPTAICVRCLHDLSIAYQFKTMCLETNEKFQKLLSVVKIEYEDVIKESNENSNDWPPDDVDDWPAGENGFVKEEPIDMKYNVQKNCNSETPQIFVKVKKKRGPYKKSTQKMSRKPKVTNVKLLHLPCPSCDKRFDSKKLWTAHRKELHKDEALWVCELCGKQFVHRGSLTCHLRSHLPPEFSCDQCDYSTSNRSDLIKHFRIHSGEKMYQCQYCTNLYRTSSNLSSHIRRNHENSRPYPCTKCDKRFFDKTKLTRHMDSHNNVKRHECEVCHSCFTRRCHWKKHLERQHNITVPIQRPGRRRCQLSVDGDKEIKGTPGT